MEPTSESKFMSSKAIFTTVASLAATAMVIRSFTEELLPHEFRDYFFLQIRGFFSKFSNQLTMVIDEFDGLVNNQLYESAEIYLGSKLSPSPSTQRLKISQPEKESNTTITMDSNEEVLDTFNNVKFRWVMICRQIESKNFYNPRDMNTTLRSEVRCFELSFHKKHKQLALDLYLPHIVKEAKLMKQEKKTIKIHTVNHEHIYGSINNLWTPINLDHPATFDTLAMEAELKKTILDDLDRFVKRREYYRKIGKAWKRGYLLYGPPGTGKSSLVAAMANYLHFDIYDLELTSLRRNSELRRLLVATANKSILVVEDIDCTIELKNRSSESDDPEPSTGNQREPSVTLSGLLNFTDGLWSSCGDERVIIFTTNYKDKLDPALLRPGRMDMHIHLSYCTPCGFRLLASNYLGIKEHALFEEIEGLIPTAEVTPAEVAEQLLKEEMPEVALKRLVEFLNLKLKENEEAKVKRAQEEEEAKAKKAQDNAKKIDIEQESKKEENSKGEKESVVPNGNHVSLAA